jgi:hypothetical protein
MLPLLVQEARVCARQETILGMIGRDYGLKKVAATVDSQSRCRSSLPKFSFY